MDSSHLFLKACRRQPVPRTPVWFMRQAGRYMQEYRELRARHSLLELCRTPELAAAITLQPLKKLGVDAAIIFADLLLPAQAMGMKLEFAEGDGLVRRSLHGGELHDRGQRQPQLRQHQANDVSKPGTLAGADAETCARP